MSLVDIQPVEGMSGPARKRGVPWIRTLANFMLPGRRAVHRAPASIAGPAAADRPTEFAEALDSYIESYRRANAAR
jgi:hypothetical protein